MRRYTTPTLHIKIQDVDLSGMQIYVTLSQYDNAVTIDGVEASFIGGNTELEVDLSQVDTSGFIAGKAKIQINWKDAEGKRNATTIKTIHIDDNILREVV